MKINKKLKLLKIAMCCGMIGGTFCMDEDGKMYSQAGYDKIQSEITDLSNLSYDLEDVTFRIVKPTAYDLDRAKEVYEEALDILKEYKDKHILNKDIRFYVNEIKHLVSVFERNHSKWIEEWRKELKESN